MENMQSLGTIHRTYIGQKLESEFVWWNCVRQAIKVMKVCGFILLCM